MLILTLNHDFRYETEKLVRVFFPEEKIVISDGGDIRSAERQVDALINREGCWQSYTVSASIDGKQLKKEQIGDVSRGDDAELTLCTLLFHVLCELTGTTPAWGLLTGVRPAKLMRRLTDESGSETAAAYFRDTLLVSPEKTALAARVCANQRALIREEEKNCFSLYVSIPFCPTRCSYCSFVSHSIAGAGRLLNDYVVLLCQELQTTAGIAAELGLKLKSVYVGGGTPTVLSAEQLEQVLSAVNRYFDRSACLEFTVEAGRPDTITPEKLTVIRRNAADRISINPQTFRDSVLEEIGRRHTAEQTVRAYEQAQRAGFDNINMDLIAGLPTDTPEGFAESLEKTISLAPANITVHTLALKRASSLVVSGRASALESDTASMLAHAGRALTAAGYEPYYMYRQSKTVGNLENTGWAVSGKACLYNIYMMEELHSVLACGAGAVTRLKREDSACIERIFNFKYPYEYIDRFAQCAERKDKIYEFYQNGSVS